MMRQVSVIVILLCAAATLAAAQEKRNAVEPPIVVQEIDIAGLEKLIRPAAGNTQPLLVNFWATWCEPCRVEFPDLVKIDKAYRLRGLRFVTVSLDDVSNIDGAVPEFLREMRARRMPAYLLNAGDPETAINAVDPTWSGALPATFLYDAQGQIVFKHTGRIKPAELRAALEKVIPASKSEKTAQPPKQNGRFIRHRTL